MNANTQAQATSQAPPSPNQPAGYIAPPQQDPRYKSPLVASFLSVIPGLGQIYVGYYPRGFIHAITCIVLITTLATGDLDALIPFVSLFLAFFWLYNIIDAGRRATAYNEMLVGGERLDPPQDFKMPGLRGSMFGGLTLIAVGGVLLLNTRFDFSLQWIEEWWPLGPIVFGVYLVVKAVQERAADADGAS